MAARPYRLGRRQAAQEQTRARIVAAARELLAAPGGVSGFTVDAVAAQAGVSRMTVFNQFESKIGVLEALFDDLAARGLVERLRAAFTQPGPREALDELIAAFVHFWASDRTVIRRVRALAAIDTDFEQAVRARDERRRAALGNIIGQLGETAPDVIDTLHTLTSFETFDGLAGPTRGPEDVVRILRRLAQGLLGLDAEAPAVPSDVAPQRRPPGCRRPRGGPAPDGPG
jgi:AcrR family transcriptional regulator